VFARGEQGFRRAQWRAEHQRWAVREWGRLRDRCGRLLDRVEARQRDNDEVRGRFGETDSGWECLSHWAKLALPPGVCVDVEALGVLLGFGLRERCKGS